MCRCLFSPVHYVLLRIDHLIIRAVNLSFHRIMQVLNFFFVIVHCQTVRMLMFPHLFTWFDFFPLHYFKDLHFFFADFLTLNQKKWLDLVRSFKLIKLRDGIGMFNKFPPPSPYTCSCTFHCQHFHSLLLFVLIILIFSFMVSNFYCQILFFL